MSSETLLKMVPVDLVDENPRNPRKHFDKDALAELTDSVRCYGVVEPILVRPVDGGRFEVIAGARRLRASRAAEKTEVPALVRKMTEAEALEIAVVENLQRADIHPLEEAEGYEQLLAQKERPLTVEDLAAKIGKSVRYVYGRLQLAKLCPKAREAFYEGQLTPSTALLLARIPRPELQEKALQELKPRYGDDDVPVTIREATRIIHDRFMLRLADAPFDPADPGVSADAPACTACPKRTGAQPQLFEDVASADVCTDPVCYQAKVAATWKRKAAEAKKTGQRVIDDKKEKKLFQDYGMEPELRYNAGFVELDKECSEDPKRRTYRKLLGEHAGEAVVLARDPRGGIHELLPEGSVKALLNKAGHEFKRQGYAALPRHKPTPADRAAAEKERQASELREATDRTIRRLLVTALGTKAPDKALWLLAIDELRSVDDTGLIEERWPCEGKKPDAYQKMVDAELAKLAPEELRGIALALTLAPALEGWHVRDRGPALLKWAGIDRKAVEKQVKADLAAAAPPPAVKKGGRRRG